MDCVATSTLPEAQSVRVSTLHLDLDAVAPWKIFVPERLKNVFVSFCLQFQFLDPLEKKETSHLVRFLLEDRTNMFSESATRAGDAPDHLLRVPDTVTSLKHAVILLARNGDPDITFHSNAQCLC